LAPTLLSGLALGIGLLVGAGNLQAATLIWTNGNGNFNDGTKWDAGTAPIGGDNTWFTNGISYTVTFTNSPSVISNDFVTGSGTVTYNIGANVWTITNGFCVGGNGDTGAVYLASGTLVVTNFGIYIGDTTNVVGGTTAVTNGVGTFVVTNGIVRSVNTVLGGGGGSHGTLIIRGPGAWTNITAGLGPITVGKSTSNNLLVVANGGKLCTSVGTISTAGENWSNTGLVYGASSLWTNLNDLSVGGTCGALIISNGGKLAVLGTLTAGNLGSSTGCVVQIGGLGSFVNAYVYGTVKVGGNSSTLDSVLMVTNALLTSGSLNMGSGGASYGTAYVLAGGTWDVTGRSFKIGAISGSASSNNVFIINQGVVTNIGSAQMGGTLCSQSGLIVTNGGKMFQSTETTIGGRDGSVSNFAIVTGAGSVWNVGTNMSVGSGLINPNEIHDNWLLVTDSGVITNVESLNLANNSGTSTPGAYMYGNYAVITNSGKFFAKHNLRIGNGRSTTNNWMLVTDGGMFSAGGNVSVGRTNDTSYGNALYVGGVGAFSTVSVVSNVIVGEYGCLQNTVVVTNGQLTADSLYIGGTLLTSNEISGSVTTPVVYAVLESTNNTVVIGTGGSVLLGGTAIVFAADTLDMQGGELAASGVVTNFGTIFGTIQGFGTVVGDMIFTNGGFFGVSNSLGQLTFSNSLTMVSNTTTTVELGTNFNTTVVSSNLTLDGTLNIVDGGGFSGGSFALFSYGGTLTTNGTTNIMTIGTVPDPSIAYTLDISSNGFVILNALPPPPTACFSSTPTNLPAGSTVTFTDCSTGLISNWCWIFGDGNTNCFTTATNPVHTYSNAGTYTVALIVCNVGGCSTNTKSNYIVVHNPPVLAVNPGSRDYGTVTVGQSSNQTFSVINSGDWPLTGTVTVATGPFSITSGSPYTVPPGQTGTVTVAFTPSSGGCFTNNVVFASNGGVSTNQVTGCGLTPGNIVVTPATNDFGTIAVGTTNQAPFFTVTNTGDTAVTNGTAALVTGGSPFSIVSGSPFSVAGFGSTNVVVQFAPVTAGAFTNNVAFRTANGGDRTNMVIGTGAIVPVANFTGSPTNGEAQLTVTFSNTSSGTITNASWVFGDTATSNTTAASVVHSYAAGTNTVSLTVFGPLGTNTMTRTDYIVATNPPPPVAGFVASVTNGSAPLAVTFTNTSTGSITNWSWAFGDGGTASFATATNPAHTYTNAGTFTVSLMVCGNGGCDSMTKSNYIVVLDLAVLQVNPGSLNFGSVTVSNTSTLNFFAGNIGGRPLTGTATVATGPFSITSGSPYNGVSPGQTGTVTVAFTPPSVGCFTDNVIFASNGGDSTNQVTGCGTTPGNISVTPANIDFGLLATGMTAQGTFTVSNSGSTAVTNGTATVASPFSIISGSLFTVPGFGSTNVVVQFAPVTAGVFTNNVAFRTANGGDRTNTVTGTARTDITGPTLDILHPSDYEVFLTNPITASGTASDASGIYRVTVNGATASGTTNWSRSVTLSASNGGTNTITVIATDNSPYHYTTTGIVHAVFAIQSTNPPIIYSPPVVTNALLQLRDMAVVVGGETNTFSVGAVDPNGYPLIYQWMFGDGATNAWSPSNTAQHAYTTNCGPYTAGVTVSNANASVSSNLIVAVACELTITKMQMKLNFAKPDADSASLSAVNLDLGAGFGATNKVFRVDIGGTPVRFTLDGKGRGVGRFGSCKLAYKKKTGKWTFTVKLLGGSWQTLWAPYGLVNADVNRMIVMMPVVVVIGNDAFAGDRPLFYTAKAGKSGMAN
jgi:PKD repeat protein